MTEIPFFFQNKNGAIILGRLGFIRLFAFGKILDIGCGLGTTFGDKATNLDILSNEEMKTIVKKQDPGLYLWFKSIFPDEKTANYVQADATKHIPFEDKTFDCAVLSEVLEHMNETETNKMLKEAGRVADFVIISVPNEWEWPKEIQFNKNVEGKARLGEGVWTGHITFHTQETISKAVQDAGLTRLLYLKVNIEFTSHHVLIATNTPCLPVNYRWGWGYGIGATNHEVPVTLDEVVSYIPYRKLKPMNKN